MNGRIDARLKELGLVLPTMVAPVASYVPFVRSGSLLFVSGQIPMGPKGLEYTGCLGRDVTVEQGAQAARLTAINAIAAAKAALDGDLDRIARVVKITGFVHATQDFTQHPEVVNGASELFIAVFGEAGRHARSAVGSSSLPRNVSVETESIFEVA